MFFCLFVFLKKCLLIYNKNLKCTILCCSSSVNTKFCFEIWPCSHLCIYSQCGYISVLHLRYCGICDLMIWGFPNVSLISYNYTTLSFSSVQPCWSPSRISSFMWIVLVALVACCFPSLLVTRTSHWCFISTSSSWSVCSCHISSCLFIYLFFKLLFS